MSQHASMVLVPDQNEIDLARSPFSYYGIDDKYVQKSYYIFCANCDKIEQERKTFKICLKCKQLGVEKWEPLYHYYCSKNCQIEHWKIHRDEHIQYEKAKIRQYNLDGSLGTESEEQKAEREDTLPNDPVPKRDKDEPGNESCKNENGNIILGVLMCDRASSPMSEDTGVPDKVEFDISAGTSSAKSCLGEKIVKGEGCVETSMVDLLKQETTPDGMISATATPVYEERVICAKNVWQTQVPMGKNPSKDIELRGKKKDSATSPPQKGDLITFNPLKTGRGSAKTVADVSDVPSKVSSEPFWKPENHDSKVLPTQPSGSDVTPAKALTLPEPDVAKAIAKSKPKKKKKDHEVKDVSSLSNKYVSVVDVNACSPLEPKHYDTDDSSSGSDVGGYMMYILTDEIDGTRSAVVQKRKDKHKANFNPRILFEKEHQKKQRAIPRKDGKPRQEVTFRFSHSSDDEEEISSESSSSGTERKAITSSSESTSGTSKTQPKSTDVNSTSTSASQSAAAKSKNAEVSAGSETASSRLEDRRTLISQNKKVEESKFKEREDSNATMTVKANETTDEKRNVLDTKSESRANKMPVTRVSLKSESPTKVGGDTKLKIDPLPGLHSVCQKINKAFAEEIPRSSRIIEVTVSDDEIEQCMFQKSTDYIDQLFSGKLEKPKKKRRKGVKIDPPVLRVVKRVDNKTSVDVAKNESRAVETTAARSADKSDQENASTVKIGTLSETGMASGSVGVNQKESLEASKNGPQTHEKTAVKSADDRSKDAAAATASTPVGLLDTTTEGLGISSPKTSESTVKQNGTENKNEESQSRHIDTQTTSKEGPSKSVSIETTKSLKHDKTETQCSSNYPEAPISEHTKKSSSLETEDITGSTDTVRDKTTKSLVKSTPLGGATPSNSVTPISEKPQGDDSSENTDKKSIIGDSPKEDLSKVQRSKFWANERIGRARETEHFLADLASIQGPSKDLSGDSLDRRNFVLENAAYAGQDIKVAITRTRANRDHKDYDVLADTCALKYYVSRKIKIEPIKRREKPKTHGRIILKPKRKALDGQGSETVSKNKKPVNLEGSTVSGKKENAEIPSKENLELNRGVSSSDTTSATPSSEVPVVEYDMSSQPNPSADFMSTGKFKVLNSDKEFGDIFSEESISQLSNPAMDVTRIFNPKDEPLNKVPHLDYEKSLKPMSEKPLDIPPGGAVTVFGSGSREDRTTSRNVASRKKTVAASQLNSPNRNRKTIIALRRGQFGFGVETVGEYRVFTHLYAKKRWITEEIEECGDED